MGVEPLTWALIALVFAASTVAGIGLIGRALAERRSGGRPAAHWLRRAAGELRFRLRLAAGLALVLWVILGVITLIARGR